MRVVGNISGFHGIKGEIKIHPLVDDLGLFYDFKEIEIGTKKYEIDSVRPHKSFLLVKLKDLNSLNDVEALSGYVKADLNEELAEGEIYIDDLISLDVLDEDSKTVGTVSNFYSSGQSLLGVNVIEELNCKRELLIPYVDEFILELNKKEGFIRIKLDEDLLELAQ